MTDRSSGAANVIDMTTEVDRLAAQTPKPSFEQVSTLTRSILATGKLPAKFPDWFGPGIPITPVAPPVLAGRQWDYQPSINFNSQPRAGDQKGAVAFGTLRMMADRYDLLRLVIETRKDQVCKMEYAVVPEDNTKEPDDRCAAAMQFLKRPDGFNSWNVWMRMLLEDAIVLDAATIYPRRDQGGKLMTLDIIDGSTIKRIVDDGGRTPFAPYPAYQQYMKGVPAWQYTRDQLIYAPRNMRSNRLYGYGPVEQLLFIVNVALRREAHQLAYYTEGATPDLILSVPADWTPDQVAQFEMYWNDQLSGQVGERRKTKFVFDGVNALNTKEAILTDKFDEWIARVVCYCFGMSSQPFTAQVNRATAETAAEQAKEEGLAPWLQWVEDVMTLIIQQHMGFNDLKFKFSEEEETSADLKATIYDKRLRNGSISIDEYRSYMGEDSLPDGQGAKYLIYTASGATPLDRVLEPPLAPTEPVATVPADKTPTEASPESGGGSTSKKAAPTASAARITAQVKKVFKTMPADIAAQLKPHLVVKISEQNRARATAMVSNLDLSQFGTITKPVQDTLESAHGTSATKAYKAVKPSVTKAKSKKDSGVPFNLINEEAAKFAAERAAELISTDANGGELGDATRLLIRGTIEEALDEGWTTEKLADELIDTYAFSDERAELIGETEMANALMQGELAGWKASGVVEGKEWLVSNNESCDECEANADQGVVPIDEDFDSGDDAPPAHPNCQCSMAPVVSEEE